jgi:hypothetical protein
VSPEGSERGGGVGSRSYRGHTTWQAATHAQTPPRRIHQAQPPTSTTRCIVSATHTTTTRRAHASLPAAPPTSFAQPAVAAPPNPRMHILHIATTEINSQVPPVPASWHREGGGQLRPLGLPGCPSRHHSPPCRAQPPLPMDVSKGGRGEQPALPVGLCRGGQLQRRRGGEGWRKGRSG